ncbi:unnamed protein product [Lepeophtheirus salmonis]|uniref:(salmon louse) hypothetical protein n=1 Tax=Lepeophtheirus salmonis TaxID=72036 RepID=A0A7R8CT33_LEPSM|nr:unnamed protein product [Lepeophtheirus salmonis]CAF2922611.1 unnamed protein product [Lepeophtheirus salmonis]
MGSWEISVINNEVDDLVRSFKSDEVDFEICGNYTHGSTVKGSVKVNLEHIYINHWSAPNILSSYSKKSVIAEDDSCTTVSINNTVLAKSPYKKETPFLVTAKLTEVGTEIVLELSKREKVIFTHAELDFGDSSLEHIIGQFRYVMLLELQEHASVQKTYK